MRSFAFFPSSGRAAQRGATLVETLVASLVLAVGVLGTAILFLQAVQANRGALLRTQAVHLAADLAERIRANRDGRAAYAAGSSASAAASRRAAEDLSQWQLLVAQRLPAPRDGSAATQLQFRSGVPGAVPDRYRIRVAWSEPGQPAVWTQLQLLDLLPDAAP